MNKHSIYFFKIQHWALGQVHIPSSPQPMDQTDPQPEQLESQPVQNNELQVIIDIFKNQKEM